MKYIYIYIYTLFILQQNLDAVTIAHRYDMSTVNY
jgi:hypothetical protein